MRKFTLRAIPFLLIAAIVLALVFYPKKQTEAAGKKVVRVWNVDTFEGGKGSRTTFLKSVARETEKSRGGVYFLVSSYTVEGARAAFKEGFAPDILSFGVGLSEFAELSLPLPYSFAGGALDGNCLAYPWCRGGYYLFSLTENFEEEGALAISCGGSNLPAVSACLEGLTGEELPALTAYTSFLNGRYRYLLGTQRDVCRFEARGVTVYQKPLAKYNDLYQYISVLSAELREECFAFLDVLFSQKIQGRLSELGMYPLEGKFERTAGVFTSTEALSELASSARAGDVKSTEKFLKAIEK